MGKKFRNKNGRRILDYDSGREFVWHLYLSSEDEWWDWAHNARRGATFIPRDPVAAYADHGWVSWVRTKRTKIERTHQSTNPECKQMNSPKS